MKLNFTYLSSDGKMNTHNNINLDDLGPLYHSYRLFGIDNRQISVVYEKNQLCKERILLAYIQYAIAKCKQTIATSVSFAEIFCADGYYAMLAYLLGANRVIGLDNDRDGFLANGRLIAQRLGIPCRFIKEDVSNIRQIGPVDIVANIGGLYHVSNPIEVIRTSYECCAKYLIIQSVVSLATSRNDYFESPAPGLSWGCRFSLESFDRMMNQQEFRIIDKHFNELEGNQRLEDRGSVYYLIEKN